MQLLDFAVEQQDLLDADGVLGMVGKSIAENLLFREKQSAQNTLKLGTARLPPQKFPGSGSGTPLWR